jgi:hypothetical protein
MLLIQPNVANLIVKGIDYTVKFDQLRAAQIKNGTQNMTFEGWGFYPG